MDFVTYCSATLNLVSPPSPAQSSVSGFGADFNLNVKTDHAITPQVCYFNSWINYKSTQKPEKQSKHCINYTNLVSLHYRFVSRREHICVAVNCVVLLCVYATPVNWNYVLVEFSARSKCAG